MRNFAVVGQSLEHSFSPEFFRKKFARLGLHDVSYKAIETDYPDGLKQLIQSRTLDGFNVTVPYKESIMPMLDNCDPVAKKIGAVNCVQRIGDRYHGYNTDHIGFSRTLKPMIKGRTVQALVLGSGGAAKAVVYVLERLGIPYRIVSRKSNGIAYADLEPGHMKEYKLVINCTPLGTWPRVDEKPDIPYGALSFRNVLYDLNYNPGLTSFLREGLAQGATVRNGLEMLRIQANESWKIWNS